MRKEAIAVAFGALLVLPMGALASATETGPVGQPESTGPAIDGGMGWSALRLLVGLGIVLAIVMAIAWFMRRRQGIAPRMRGSLPGIEALGAIALAPNRAIHVVRMGDEVILVAMSENAATVIGRRAGDEAEPLLGRSLVIEDVDPLARQLEGSLREARQGTSPLARLRRLTVRP